jgi:hypothetical protein
VGTGAIFLKLYNGIVVGQQGEGFLREGKYYLKTNQNIMLRTSVHFCPLFIHSFNPVQPKILEPTAPCFKKRNRNSKQQPHPHLERTKTTQT